MDALKSLAVKLGGEVRGAEVAMPGPGHSSSDRSLLVKFDPSYQDGFIVYSFAGDDAIECRDHVRCLLDMPTGAPLQKLPRSSASSLSSEQKTKLAKQIWDTALPAVGSPVEQYLIGRGLSVVPEIETLRFHSACPFKGDKVPAMIAPIINHRTGEFQGIHRTKLNPKDKAMLGPAKYGVVKLSPDDEVLEGLSICEGIETGIALLNAGIRPVWACLSANGMVDFQVRSGIESLNIFVDNDINQTGQNAGVVCAWRHKIVGIEARILSPKIPGTDFAERSSK